MNSSYYSKLKTDHIRLLKIHAQELPNAVSRRLELIHVLDSDLDNTRYEAVSYVWGSSERQKTIELVDGSPLEITITLHEALPHLIAASNTGMLWIDQLCIDQDNKGEKSHQVPKMGLIYTRAERTLAWLGIVPAAHTHFSRLIPVIHQELDAWVKIHGEDPLFESPDESTGHVSAFVLFRQIIHNRRTLKSKNWGTMLTALSHMGFKSETENWSMGTSSDVAGGFLWRPYRMSGDIREYHLLPNYDGTHKDLNLDDSGKKKTPEELEILKREDSLIFYCYRAVLNIGTILTEGKTEDLAASIDTIIENLRPLLDYVLGHSWCTRVWIMQEVKLSNNVEFLINDEIFKPQQLLRLQHLFRFCRSAIGNKVSERFVLHEAKWSNLFNEDHDYRETLSKFLIRRMERAPIANEQASDPRDLIYGLLPICKPEPYLPTTDYDLNVSQVYAAATRYFIERHDSLWVLQFCGNYPTHFTCDNEDPSLIELPSWVPDWSSHFPMEPLSTSYYPCIYSGGPRCVVHNDGRIFNCPICGDGGIAYSAAGQRKYVTIEENSPEVLTIQGKVIDEVMDLVLESEDEVWGQHLAGILSSSTSDNRFQSQMNEAFTDIIEHAARFRDVTTPLSRRDLLEFLFVSPYLYQPFAFRAYDVDLEELLRRAEEGDITLAGFPQPGVLRRYFAALLGRNFAMTESGFYFGPDTMQKGDRIAIIHGSEFPLVLRPLSKDEQTYVFVGQCVIQDRRIMFGDAVDWEETDAQTFRLV